MQVLITGAGGFLGRGLVTPFEEHGHRLRLMDVVPFASPHEVVVGDVRDYPRVEAAMQGCDALIINHMAPRGEANVNYQHPALPFATNVDGTACCFHAALRCGVRRVVVISSGAAVLDNPDLSLDPRTLPWRARDYYGLTKACQELVAQHFARTAGMSVCCLRPGYVLDGDRNVDKYGRPVSERNFQDTDRRDIGEAARLWLERGTPGYDVFAVLSTREGLDRGGVRFTCERLGWQPRYDFGWLREPAAAAGAGA